MSPLLLILIVVLAALLGGCQDRHLRSCFISIVSLGPVEYYVGCPPRGIAIPE